MLDVALALVDDDRDVLVEAEELGVLEGVEDDAQALELLRRPVEVARAVGPRVREPERHAVAEVLLALAADAELERRAELGDADGRRRPDGALLRLAVRRQPHEVAVDRRAAARAPGLAHDALAVGVHLLEGGLEAQGLDLRAERDRRRRGEEREQGHRRRRPSSMARSHRHWRNRPNLCGDWLMAAWSTTGRYI